MKLFRIVFYVAVIIAGVSVGVFDNTSQFAVGLVCGVAISSSLVAISKEFK